MKRYSNYPDLVQRLKQQGRLNGETFEINGERFPYCDSPGWKKEEREYFRAVYRDMVYRMLSDAKEKDELRNLPCKEKLRRYSKNAGLEILVGFLNALTILSVVGGISICSDGLLDKKESTYLSYKKEKRFFEEHGHYPDDDLPPWIY